MIENKNRTEEEAKSVEVAEDSRELDWKSKSFMASLYMGDMDWSLLSPYPQQDPDDKAIGDEICAKVDAWAHEHLDGDEIDKTGIIPASVFRGLKELGLFGIKIPKKYGGLGLSQTNYMRVLGTVATHCGSTVGTLSAHQSIGLPQPLKLFGTEAQKEKYLPMCAEGTVTAFALTEVSVGSDPANMSTFAEKSEDGRHWILNGEKLWCTNGVIADILVVMARTASKMVNGREKKQISAFIVETDIPGVEVFHRCEFMGLRAVENGIIRFKNVRIPVENILCGEGDGLRLALTTLNDGRLGIPAVTSHASQRLSKFSAQWAKTRYQWGRHIGQHEAGADKLSFVTASTLAMDTFASFGAALSDRGDIDIRMEAAAAKLFCSELGWESMDVGLQLRGGRGYETAQSLEARGEASFPLERALRDTRINRIVEGTSDVMHLFLAREALDKHLSIAGGLFKRGATLGDKIATIAKASVFYVRWYPMLWIGGFFKRIPKMDSKMRSHLSFVEKRSRKLARTLFHNMIFLGPKLESRQLTLARIVDIGVELTVMALVASRTAAEIKQGNTENQLTALYWLKHGQLKVDRLFHDLSNNADAQARVLSKRLLEEAELLPETDSSGLKPLQREKGSDLTSGRQSVRLGLGGELPKESKAS